jgi:quinol-cytochrome oxidoreductase complex cytochrome b subunit
MTDERRQSADDRREPVRGGKEAGPPNVSRDVLVRMEVIAMLAATVGLMVLSLIRPAPLGEMPDPASTPIHVTAPWIFAWVQELLRHLPALLGGVVVPVAVFFLILFLPFFGAVKEEEGRSPARAVTFPFLLLSVLFLLIIVISLMHYFR